MNAREVFSIDNFYPSKNRNITNNAILGAAQNQPSGKALPSLVLGQWGNPADHLRAARLVNPTADLINVALAPNTKLAISDSASDPGKLVNRRTEALPIFLDTAASLDRHRSRWTRTLPGDSTARNFHFR